MNSAYHPLISCIIATRNAADHLQTLLTSLAAQSTRDFEVIVQDCCSSDATLDIIAEQSFNLPAVCVISEPDTGIYDAWNKAVARAKGRWILFLGADDTLPHATALASVSDMLLAQPDSTLYVAGPIIMGRADDSDCDVACIVYPSYHPARDLPQGMAFPHQGLFHRASLFQNFTFATTFRIAGDYEFVARTFREGGIAFYHSPVVRMALGGVSSRIDSLWRVEWEQWRVARQYFPYSFPWKIGVRLLRSVLCLGIAKIAGVPRAEAFADMLRRLRGKKALWSASGQNS